ncbi:UDP-2,3-diacylglucosamine diphosphatase [Orbaceae bacterium ESL0727]|nr:UDP-2,3-diacylglucosamine diphosphatase [Orbaceae bacterium ESL0727]
MQRYFIADIHLTEDQPALTAGFFSFLDTLPNGCELYILGDLFDYWIGDDIASPFHQQVAKALRTLSQRQIKKYFVQGNRDFLLGRDYCQLCDMTLLPDINTLPLADKTLLFLHGDLLCTDDVQYQKFRQRLRYKWLQRLFLWSPRRFRQAIAKHLRQKSIKQNQNKSAHRMDVNQQAVLDMLNKYQATVMIHGHTHKPATHELIVAGQPLTRLVLSAWHDGVSYIKQDDSDNNIKLYFYPTL